MNSISVDTRPPWPWQQRIWQRLCEQKHAGALAHAHLFSGEKGTGRAAFAREYASFLLCAEPDGNSACYQCRSCRAGGPDHHPDLLMVLPEEGKKDIRVDQIRELTDFLGRSSFSGLARVAIVLQAERLTLAAANALLKTLEEPAESAYLLLAGISPGSLLPTIRSRCQLLPLPAPDPETAADWLCGRLSGDKFESREQLIELFDVYGNRPLELLDALNSGQTSGFFALRQSLTDLLKGQISVQHAARESAKSGDSATFEHLDRISTILIRGLAQGDWHTHEHRAIADALPEPDSATRLRAMLEFHRQVAVARKQLAGPGNPNPLLLLEGIFLLWSHREMLQAG